MSIRVLVVEDEPPAQRLVAQCIEQSGGGDFVVVGRALNGRQALQLLPTLQPDVVFTDMRMPVMDGPALVQQLQRQAPQVAVVILSGYQDFEYLRQAVVCQAVDYLLKPVTPQSVAPVLQTLRDRFAAQARRRQEKLLQQLLGGEVVEVPPPTGRAPMRCWPCARGLILWSRTVCCPARICGPRSTWRAWCGGCCPRASPSAWPGAPRRKPWSWRRRRQPRRLPWQSPFARN